MESGTQAYLKLLLGVIIGALFIWIGVTGRLGSLLGAFITPGAMIEGTPPSPNGSTTSTSNGTVNNSAKQIAPSSGTLTDVQIAQYAVTAGVATLAGIATATAISIQESGGNTHAHNPGNGTTDIEDSYGLWQVNVLAHPSYDKTQLYDPSYNAAAMYAISSGGTRWGAWGSYKTGAYQKYMNRGLAAANNVFKGI